MFANLLHFADASAASEVLKSSTSPLFNTMVAIAGIACVLFIVFGGYYYMTSAGNPERLERAKKTIRNAFIGLAVVIGAAAVVGIMQNAYSAKPVQEQDFSKQQEVKPPEGNDFKDAVNAAISGFVKDAITSIGKPIIETLKQFTTATPLMAQNGAVFNLWLVIVAIADVLFLLVVGLLGFKIMSASVLGLEEVDLRSLAPQLIIAFIIANLSIFFIDAIISVSNAMIQALLIGMSSDIIWASLLAIIIAASTLSIGVLLLLAFLVILAIALLIYYLKRLVILYVGAVLSPLVVLLWLLPSFRDFASAATKRYITTIFVLFVHIVILMLAVAIFASILKGDSNPFMTSLIGIATILILIGTGRELDKMAIISSGNNSMRKLGSTFVRSASHMSKTFKEGAAAGGVNVGSKAASAAASTGGSSTRILSNTASSKFNQGSSAQALMKPEQVSRGKAAELLTSKQKQPNETVISPGTQRGKVTVTRQALKGLTK